MKEQATTLLLSKTIPIPTNGMEDVLTRAIFRVLNHAQASPDNSNNMEKPNSYMPIANGQLRLVAEQLCKRMERRYEKRLMDEREKDRSTTDRRLQAIRSEYKEELEQEKRKLERDRMLLEDLQKEKERTMLHSLDIRFMDRENNLEIQRKLLENRFHELTLVKEQLEKASGDFKRKMKAELDAIRIEWDKVAAKESSTKVKSGDSRESNKVNTELFNVKQKEVEDLQRSLIERSQDVLTLRNKVAQLEADLSSVRVQLKTHVDDKNEAIRTNRDLLLEVQELKRERNEFATVVKRRQAVETALREDSCEHKVKELKTVVNILNTKLKSITSERNYLREELRAVQIESCSRKSRQTSDEQRMRKKIERRPPTLNSESALSDDESDLRSTDSLYSNGTHEINQIKLRIRNLDDIAKELDQSVEHFTNIRSSQEHYKGHHSPSLDYNEGYDDFCRLLIRDESKQSSPVKMVLSKERSLPTKTTPVSTLFPPQSKVDSRETAVVKRESVTNSNPPLTPVKASPPSQSDKREEARIQSSIPTPADSVVVNNTPAAEPKDALFEGVDPVMEKYMKLVMQSRTNTGSHKIESPIQPQESTENVSKGSVEIMEAGEVHLEAIPDSDNEIEW